MMQFQTRGGRHLVALGDESLLSTDRLECISSHMDADPRVATVSLVAGSSHHSSGVFLRATMPAGPVLVMARDLADLIGPLPTEWFDQDGIRTWARAAAERGLGHHWLIASESDVAEARVGLNTSVVDMQEQLDPSGAHYEAFVEAGWSPEALSVVVDATWLGPHETGAQVLATAAIEALSRQDRIASIELIGIEDLPRYARHLSGLPKVALGRRKSRPADIVWYPNQIDMRSDIGIARSLGSRCVVTYLDLIAYDIPRYHSSTDAWLAYRTLQRTVALSVDGITTISADVANRLQSEVPRLDPRRIQPILLGLDHVVREVPVAGADIADLTAVLSARPFILVLGNDFLHKNRDFAVRVWEEVLNRGIACDLVLAGLHVRSSSTGELERSLLSAHTNLRGRFHSVGHVSSGSRSWLLQNAAAVMYPSSAEGFGFVPYEAAALGTPTTFTSFGPLFEVSRLKSIPPSWSIDGYAEDLALLLTDERAAQERVEGLRDALEWHTWDTFARELSTFFTRIRSLPTESPVWPLADINESHAAMNPSRSARLLRAVRSAPRSINRLRH